MFDYLKIIILIIFKMFGQTIAFINFLIYINFKFVGDKEIIAGVYMERIVF